jgi:magnesium chelatase family protein
MLAKRLPSILTLLTIDQALQTAKIHSLENRPPIFIHMGGPQTHPYLRRWCSRLRVTRHTAPLPLAPHQTISDAGLIDGDIVPRPGEVSLWYNGLHFLDELFDFPRNVLKVMRQSLQEHTVTIASSSMSLGFPARFIRAAIQGRESTAQRVTQDSFSFDLRRKYGTFFSFKEQLFSFSISRIKLC